MTSPAVLVLFNEPGPCPGAVESDAGVLHETAAVCAALATLGVRYRRVGVRTLEDVGRALRHAPEPCVINLVETLNRSAADACLVPAVCAALGKAWTGSGTACQLLALDKWQSKCALRAAGVPVPFGILVRPGGDDEALNSLAGPVIVKPLCADASEGIDGTSVIRTPDGDTVRKRIARIHADFAQPALVESYVEGREFNVSILERSERPAALPLAEIDFSAFGTDRPRIVDYRAKWIEDSFEFRNSPRRVPAEVDEPTADRIRAAALGAWTALGCRQYARIDLRVDTDGAPFVIEVNPNPDISPDAGFSAALQAGGLTFKDFVQILIDAKAYTAGGGPEPPPRREDPGDIKVRRSRPDDRQPILSLLGATGVFESYELPVAEEVLTDALTGGEAGHYQSYTATRGGSVAGWACFGPTPCTDGTFDLYWLAVGPDHARRGVAALLVTESERLIRAAGGRLIVVETSSRSNHEPARRFYARQGYDLASAVTNFYGIGDDKLIYVKTVSRLDGD